MLRNAISGPAARNSHAHVVHGIGLAIVSGQYPVGTMLPGDLELAEQFHVSRTVLREAMKTLSAKGMVLPRAGVGTRVTGEWPEGEECESVRNEEVCFGDTPPQC